MDNAAQAQQEDNAPSRAAKPDQPLRVLVLDDDPSIRKLVCLVLEQKGYEVETASDGGEGLQLLLGNPFDVVTADLHMGPMDGITFLTEALKIWPWLGVVVISGHLAEDVRKQTSELGVTSILEKPFNPQSLLDAVMQQAEAVRARTSASGPASLDTVQYQLGILRKLTQSAIDSKSLLNALRALSVGLLEVLPAVAVGVLSLEEDESVLALFLQEPVTKAFVEGMEQALRDRYRLLSGNPLPDDLELQVEGVECSPSGKAWNQAFFSVPIITGGDITGLLALSPPDDHSYTEQEATFLYHATNHLSTVLLAFRRIRQLAVRDELTGLYNRRHLEEESRNVWDMGKRYGFSAGTIIVDIDHFKMINDTYGHPIGDLVLQEISQVVQGVCRQSDVAARYGGDEIVVILPHVTREDVHTLGERIITAIRSHVFCPGSHNLKLTVSIGAACSRTPSGQPLKSDEALSRADQALYAAKRGGRDRLVIWPPDSSQEKAPPEPAKTMQTPDAAPAESTTAGRVLVVDDDAGILRVLQKMLESQNYDVGLQDSARGAIDLVKKEIGGFDLALIDLNLNNESGIDLLDELHVIDPSLVKIVITGEATFDNALRSLRHGSYDFVQKPVRMDQLSVILSRGLEYRRLRLENLQYQMNLEQMVREKSRALSQALQDTRDSYEFTLEALAAMLDAREHNTAQHSKRVQDISCVIGDRLDMSPEDMRALRQGAVLHDIGKIAIPDAILLKNGPLTDEEWTQMRRHPEVGYDIIRTSSYLKEAAELVYSHQERYDGKGYPRNLAGEDICRGARIFCVVDAYDAMRSDRPYRNGMSLEDAVAELRRHAGSQFDPEVVQTFMECIDEVEKIGRWEHGQDIGESINDSLTSIGKPVLESETDA